MSLTTFFVDDNIVADKEAAKTLFRALMPLKIHWISQASLTMTKVLELIWSFTRKVFQRMTADKEERMRFGKALGLLYESSK